MSMISDRHAEQVLAGNAAKAPPVQTKLRRGDTVFLESSQFGDVTPYINKPVVFDGLAVRQPDYATQQPSRVDHRFIGPDGEAFYIGHPIIGCAIPKRYAELLNTKHEPATEPVDSISPDAELDTGTEVFKTLRKNLREAESSSLEITKAVIILANDDLELQRAFVGMTVVEGVYALSKIKSEILGGR